jgi:prepilin peptidase CpaA
MDGMFIALGTAVAVAAAIFDVKSHRIPNRLTYSALLAGVALHCALQGWAGLRASLWGMAIAGGIFLVFFLVGGMGAGDVKLMGAVGALAGSDRVLGIVLATAIAGGVLACVVMILRRQVGVTIRRTFRLFLFHLVHGMKGHPEINLADDSAVRLPYGLAIASGTAYILAAGLIWR